MFFKLLSHDLNNGIRKRLAYYAAALVISLTFCQGCYLVIQSLNRRGVVGLSGNPADYLVYLFQGMKVYYPCRSLTENVYLPGHTGLQETSH